MNKKRRLKLGVLVSGGGTNLQRIMDEIAAEKLDAEITVVISDNRDAHGLTRAKKAGIPAISLNRDDYRTATEFNQTINHYLMNHEVKLVVMAGYMRLLGKEVLNAFPNKVVNLHPALLPSFPGAHGIEDAFKTGVKVTGVTVHFANEKFDEGPIIAQTPVRIEEDDTLETLEKKIHAVEYELLPETLRKIAAGKVRVQGKKVKIG